jgi:tyrosine-protein kinase Etk/Wzc
LVEQRAPQFGEGSDEIDLADIGRALRRQWRKIAIITGLTTVLALFVVLTTAPIFALDGALFFGNAQLLASPTDQTGTNLLSSFQNINDVPTEVQLIQSRALVEQAILETGLNVEVDPADHEPLSYWRWKLADGARIDAFAPQPGDLTIQYATLFDPGSTGQEYTLQFGANGTYQLLPVDGSGPAALTGTLRQPAAGPGLTMLVDTAIAGAPAPAAGATYDVYITPAKALADDLINGALTVTQGGSVTEPTQTADVAFQWKDPYKGQKFINQLMRDFIATQLSWTTESASDTEQFVAGQLSKIQTSLTDADNKLAAYQAQTGIMDVPTNAQAVVTQLSQYQVQRTTALLQQQALQQLLKTINNPQGDINPYLVTEASDPVLTQLAGNLANAQVQLQSQRQQFTAAAPEVQTEQATITRTEQAIRTLLRNDESLAAANVVNLDAQIAQYEGQLKAMPSQSLQIIELTRSSQVFGQLYVLLMQNEEEAEVSKAATIVDTRVVTPAEVPLFASKPKAKITVLAGILLGLFIGTAWVLVQRALSGRFHSENDVRRHIRLPVFGLIPQRLKRELAAGMLPSRARNTFTEAFRLLRSRLYQASEGLPSTSHVVLITSPSTGDGKTTIAVNLAKSLADDGKRVLLLDADLHRGHLHEALRLPQSPGLSEWLTRREKTEPVPVKGQSFSAIPAGAYSANPSEVLSDPLLAVIFKALRTDFEYIIVDCPPLPSVADTLILLKHADIALSVLYIEQTNRSAFTAHLETFGPSNVRRGLVINGLLGDAKYSLKSYGDNKPAQSGWRRLWQ